MSSEISRVVSNLGGQTALAKLLGSRIKQGHVYQWIKRGHAPLEHVPRIAEIPEAKTTPEKLAPDVLWIRGPDGKVTHYQVKVGPNQEAA